MIKFILLFFIFYPSIISATLLSPCEPHLVEDELRLMGLDTQIKTNKDLLTGFTNIYGESLSKLLTSEHTYLLNAPDDAISPETLKWAVEAIWSPANKIAIYTPLLADFNSLDVVDEYISFAFESLFNFQNKVKLVFLTEDDADFFFGRVVTGLDEALSKHYPSLKPVILENAKKIFRTHYSSEDGHMVGFKNISHLNPTIIIEGHGRGGADDLRIGNEHIGSDEIVRKLIDMKLPNDANLILDSCFSGCGENQLNITKLELETLFKQGKLASHPAVLPGSLLYKVAKAVFSKQFSFKGTVQGFPGKLYILPVKGVLTQSGELCSCNAVEIYGLDGSMLLKKEDTRIVLHRSSI